MYSNPLHLSPRRLLPSPSHSVRHRPSAVLATLPAPSSLAYNSLPSSQPGIDRTIFLTTASGLRTPPTDEMNAACPQPQMLPCGPHTVSTDYPTSVLDKAQRTTHAFAQAVRQAQQIQGQQPGHHQQARYRQHEQRLPCDSLHDQTQQPQSVTSREPTLPQAVPSLSRSSHHLAYSNAQQPLHPQNTSNLHAHNPLASDVATNSHSTPSPRISTRTSETAMTSGASEGESGTTNAKSALVTHSMTIPSCISPNGGSLAEFAAKITRLFWFESIEVIQAAEQIRSRPNPTICRLSPHSTSQEQYKKWIHSVLSTTQITQNVVLLALLFIYRLKMKNPQVKGRPGSEYRLLTVALMLGNKFLDDNTYTNKTWAEVSYINVQDIHVMEVEFLSNMRYSLLTTKEQWEEWPRKLACFHEYCERAENLPLSPVMAVPSPAAQSYTSPIPSPTQSMPPLTPSNMTVYSPKPMMSHANHTTWLNSVPPAPLMPSGGISPLANKASAEMMRKRALDVGDVTEPPPKRLMHPSYARTAPTAPSLPSSLPNPASATRSTLATESMRLPVPSLSINTNTPSMASGNGNLTTGLPSASLPAPTPYAANASNTPISHVLLPPLAPGVRAMATVYQHASNAGHESMQQAPMPTSQAAHGSAMLSFAPSASSGQHHHHGGMGYGTPTKHHSPANNLLGYNSSPLAESFPGSSGTHTPVLHPTMSHSPSIYLQERASPYKPVRHVNALLFPPPSASLYEYHLAVQPSQMHYHPLGRRNDVRTGVVPEFLVLPRMGPHQPNGSHHQSHHTPGIYP